VKLLSIFGVTKVGAGVNSTGVKFCTLVTAGDTGACCTGVKFTGVKFCSTGVNCGAGVNQAGVKLGVSIGVKFAGVN
jgi:hypothetical protein